MSRVAAEKREERESAYKEGLGQGQGLTDRRALDAAGLRKKKHASLLQRCRGIQRPDTDGQLARMMSLYRREAVVAAGDAMHLRLLHDILECATTPFLNEYMAQLLGGLGQHNKVIPVLVKHCGESEECAAILLQLTGIITKDEVALARDIVKSGFLNVMASNERNAMNPTFWKVLLNICLSCREGRIEVLGSPLFVNGVFQRVAPQMDPVHVLSVTCALIDADVSDPPIVLIRFVWPLLMQTLIDTVQPLPWLELDERQRTLTNASTCILCNTLYGLGMTGHAETSAHLLLDTPGMATALIRKLTAMLRICRQHGLEVRLLEIMVRISGLHVESKELVLAMRAAGSARDILVYAQNPGVVARYWCFLWLGNYMSDGVTFVQEMLMAGVMPFLCAALERGETEVKAKAVYALMTMFYTCEHEQGENKALAEQMTHTLVFGHRIFARLASVLTALPGQEQMSIDVLRCLCAALRWNRREVLQSLRANHVHEHIEDMVTQLKGHLETELFTVAVEADDLLQGRAPENREAALEAAAAATLAMSMDQSEDRLLMGRFDF